MAKLSRIANVMIDLRTAAIREVSFSSMMIMGEHTLTTNRTLIITEADELIELGLESTDPLYIAATDAFSQIPSLREIYIGRKDAASAETWTDALIAANNEDSAWYGLVITSREDADILEVADWVEANEKLFFASNASEGAIDPADDTDIASQLMDGNYFRTAYWYHADAETDWLEAAVMSKLFTKPSGTETFANQRLGGVTTDKLQETAARAVLTKNGNTFEPFRNISITQGGKTAGGEWVDVIRFRDQLSEWIKVNVFQLFVDNRVPFTDDGIRQVASKLIESLDRGVRIGGLAPEEQDEDGNVIPSYRVNIPLSAQVSFNDKANRTLRELSFTARLAGAIHFVDPISGTLTYEL